MRWASRNRSSVNLLSEYCSPEMTQLMRDCDALLSDALFVREAMLRNPSGQVVTRWYVPTERNLKEEIRKLIVEGHRLGYVEATGDWG